MKAAVYEKRGLAGLFTFRDMEKPSPAANEVLVKIHAAAANALDYRLLRMGIGIPKRRIFGADIAGQVESVGKNVLLFRPGDEVFGDISGCGLGGFAEYVAVPESMLAKKPSGIMFEDAAALPVSGVTALQAIRDKGKVKPGHKVLIYGAGGGVGTFALQLAKYYGAAVTAVCGENNVGLAHSLGADMVIDYRREDFHVVGDRYNLIIAVNGSRNLSVYRQALAPGGVCVVLGGALSQLFKAMAASVLLSFRNTVLAAKSNPEDLLYLADLVKAGKIKPVIDRRYPLSEAVQYLMKGHARGKVIITVVKED